MFITITITLFVISFIGALFSLRKELSKPKELKRVEKEFRKEKILFKA